MVYKRKRRSHTLISFSAKHEHSSSNQVLSYSPKSPRRKGRSSSLSRKPGLAPLSIWKGGAKTQSPDNDSDDDVWNPSRSRRRRSTSKPPSGAPISTVYTLNIDDYGELTNSTHPENDDEFQTTRKRSATHHSWHNINQSFRSSPRLSLKEIKTVFDQVNSTQTSMSEPKSAPPPVAHAEDTTDFEDAISDMDIITGAPIAATEDDVTVTSNAVKANETTNGTASSQSTVVGKASVNDDGELESDDTEAPSFSADDLDNAVVLNDSNNQDEEDRTEPPEGSSDDEGTLGPNSSQGSIESLTKDDDDDDGQHSVASTMIASPGAADALNSLTSPVRFSLPPEEESSALLIEKRRSKTHFKPVNADDDKSNDSNAEDSSMSESSGAGDAGNSETFSGAESELAATTDNYFTAAEDKDGYTTSASRRTNPFFSCNETEFHSAMSSGGEDDSDNSGAYGPEGNRRVTITKERMNNLLLDRVGARSQNSQQHQQKTSSSNSADAAEYQSCDDASLDSSKYTSPLPLVRKSSGNKAVANKVVERPASTISTSSAEYHTPGYASSSGDESARVRAGGDDSEFSEIDDFSFGPNMAAALLASSSPASATRNNQNYYLNNQHPASQGTTDTANRQQYSSTESNSLTHRDSYAMRKHHSKSSAGSANLKVNKSQQQPQIAAKPVVMSEFTPNHSQAIEEATRWLSQTNQLIESSGKHERAISEADEWLNRTLKSLNRDSSSLSTYSETNPADYTSNDLKDLFKPNTTTTTSSTIAEKMDALTSLKPNSVEGTTYSVSINPSSSRNTNSQSYHKAAGREFEDLKLRAYRDINDNVGDQIKSSVGTHRDGNYVSSTNRPGDNSSYTNSNSYYGHYADPSSRGSSATNTWKAKSSGVGLIANSGSLGRLVDTDDDFVAPEYENVTFIPAKQAAAAVSQYSNSHGLSIKTSSMTSKEFDPFNPDSLKSENDNTNNPFSSAFANDFSPNAPPPSTKATNNPFANTTETSNPNSFVAEFDSSANPLVLPTSDPSAKSDPISQNTTAHSDNLLMISDPNDPLTQSDPLVDSAAPLVFAQNAANESQNSKAKSHLSNNPFVNNTQITAAESRPTNSVPPVISDPSCPEDFQQDWSFMLRHPPEKQFGKSRRWMNVEIKFDRENSLLKIYDKTKGTEISWDEILVSNRLFIHDIKRQKYDDKGKAHTLKLVETSYRRRNQFDKIVATTIFQQPLESKYIAEHRIRAKLGTTDYRVLDSFVKLFDEYQFQNKTVKHLQQGGFWTHPEIHMELVDTCTGAVNSKGEVLNETVSTSLYCLSFFVKPPEVRIGINDERVKGVEVVRRSDILPMKTDAWIKFDDVQFHHSVDKKLYLDESTIVFQPLDACKYKLADLKVRDHFYKDSPMKPLVTCEQTGSVVKLEAELFLPSIQKIDFKFDAEMRRCENILLVIPVPEQWIGMLRYDRPVLGEGSVKAAKRKTGYVSKTKVHGVKIQVTAGVAKYEHSYKAIVWRISRLPGKTSVSICSYKLFVQLISPGGPVAPFPSDVTSQLSYSMSWTVASGAVLRSMAITNLPIEPLRKVENKANFFYDVEIQRKNNETEA